MITEPVGQELHDRATRGMVLSAEERQILAAWHQQLDEVESQMLTGKPSAGSLDSLRLEITTLLAQLRSMTERIEAITGENDKLRRENQSLHGRLAQLASVSRV